jgi:hypothetical protein
MACSRIAGDDSALAGIVPRIIEINSRKAVKTD